MTDWTSGYVTEVGYTYGYFGELNPLRARLAFLNAGLVPPELGIHCELGFGQGLSANIHAAASGSAWYANDFNPAQARFAQILARASGASVQLTDESFADFCHRADLPDFNSIGLHGIWSWISDANRAVIVDFVRRKLKVGGVLYISYNTQPGWASFAPMRDLLLQHRDIMGAAGQGIVANLDGALNFAEKLMATDPVYAIANPLVKEQLTKLKEQDRSYLVHEYFNRNWLPMSFAAMADWLAPAKLDFACSAHYMDHIASLNLSAGQQTLLKDIPQAMFRQTVRDFMVNQKFRRDYWIKGAQQLNVLEQAEALRAQRVILIQPRADVSLRITGAIGEATMQDDVYAPILDVMADHKARTLGQIEQAVKDKGINFAQITQVAMVLTGTTALAPVQDESMIVKVRKQTDDFNAYVIDKARGGSNINYLASPVIAGGIPVIRFQQLYLLARSQGKKQPSDWAQEVWKTLSSQNQKIVKEGKPLETAEENLAELTARATGFAEKQLPILKALQIA